MIDECARPIAEYLKEWQTLAGSILALIAAFITVSAIFEQIKESRRQNRDLLDRKFKGARWILSISIDDLCKYSKEVIGYIRHLDDGALESVEHSHMEYYFPKKERIPVFPDQVILNFKEVIEYSSDKKLIQEFADLVGCIQIHNARLRELYSEIAKFRGDGAEFYRENLESVLYVSYWDAAHLYNYSEAFLNFARGCDAPPRAPTDAEIRAWMWFHDVPRRPRMDFEANAVVQD